jgi:Methyltransferase domain
MDFTDKLRRALHDPRHSLERLQTVLLEAAITLHNTVIDLLPGRAVSLSGFPPLDEIVQHSCERSDISDHLPTLFLECLPLQPTLIVELGTRGGESTFALERAAAIYGANLVSVDVNDCARVSSYPGWEFVQSDDIAFARQFAAWCGERGGVPAIDVLFVDTSHEFEHTVQEIAHWFPYLSQRAKVFFHDTHMQRIFRRRDGSCGLGWDNRRGVMAAIEQYLGGSFDGTRDFTTLCGEWIVKHHANCNGLTVLERWGGPASAAPGAGGEAAAAESSSWVSLNG